MSVPTAEDVVARLHDHVWTLVRAGHADAAVVLLQKYLPEFMAATDPAAHEEREQEREQEQPDGEAETDDDPSPGTEQ